MTVLGKYSDVINSHWQIPNIAGVSWSTVKQNGDVVKKKKKTTNKPDFPIMQSRRIWSVTSRLLFWVCELMLVSRKNNHTGPSLVHVLEFIYFSQLFRKTTPLRWPTVAHLLLCQPIRAVFGFSVIMMICKWRRIWLHRRASHVTQAQGSKGTRGGEGSGATDGRRVYPHLHPSAVQRANLYLHNGNRPVGFPVLFLSLNTVTPPVGHTGQQVRYHQFQMSGKPTRNYICTNELNII